MICRMWQLLGVVEFQFMQNTEFCQFTSLNVWGMREAGGEEKEVVITQQWPEQAVSLQLQDLFFKTRMHEICLGHIRVNANIHSLVRQTSLCRTCLSPKPGRFIFCSTQNQRFTLMERQKTGSRKSTKFSDLEM